jgi:hypothetical protein
MKTKIFTKKLIFIPLEINKNFLKFSQTHHGKSFFPEIFYPESRIFLEFTVSMGALPQSSIEVSTCTLSNILVWFGGLCLFPSPLLYCGALLRNSWGN